MFAGMLQNWLLEPILCVESFDKHMRCGKGSMNIICYVVTVQMYKVLVEGDFVIR